MDESRLRTIEQIEQFLSASTLVEFSKYGDDVDRYEHISRVLKRFDTCTCSRLTFPLSSVKPLKHLRLKALVCSPTSMCRQR